MLTCNNRSAAPRWWNTERPLTHPSDLSREGLEVNSTQAATGQRFGRWTVVGEGRPTDPRGRRRWRVRCDCGAERDVRADVLTRGVSESCGCLKRDRWDLTGQTFDRLTVQSEAEGDKNGARRWLCICSCGARKVVYGTHLTRGKTRSCGCLTTPERPSYRLVHRRVEKALGKARGHLCVDCGSRADDWSYDHADPDELVEQMVFWDSQPTAVAYSANVSHYAPRCLSCHRRFDR